MAEYIPDVESLTSEELLSIVLAMVAPAESDPMQEFGLRFEAQRAATELYCRAASAQSARVDAAKGAIGNVSHVHRSWCT